ncbi:MAG: hypothetical protein K9L17_09715 [Clostridiales bacterium]|nr:hypothetical protein [Clostridiales bacterium]MCF8022956.1 hypothetical protein [Clostridiales bacterium]
MDKVYIPDFVGRSEMAVIMMLTSLAEKLNNVMERFHNDEQVQYRFIWNLEQDDDSNYMVLLYLEFDSGEIVNIGLYPYHWDCLPSILSTGYLVIMTDERLLGDQDGTAGSEDGEPRAVVIHNAFTGLDRLVKEAREKVENDESEDLKLILKLFEESLDSEGEQYH